MRNIFRYIILRIVTLEARLVLWKYKPRIIAVTGSVGKTITKDAIFAGLENALYIRKSKKSLNSDFGVPLTILGNDSGWDSPSAWMRIVFEGLALLVFVNHYPKWLVLEVGADTPGDIQKIARWLAPEVVVLTALPDVPAHIGRFENRDAVIKEKWALAQALRSGGTLVINGDDKTLNTLGQTHHQTPIIRYGFEAHNDIRGSHIDISYTADQVPNGMQCEVHALDVHIPLRISGRLGNQHIYPALVVYAVAHAIKVHPATALERFVEKEATRGRMRILPGYRDSLIIDDTYNSSPAAIRMALTTLKNIQTSGKKIALLGDMLELGSFSTASHEKVGVQVASIVDELVVVGDEVRTLVSQAETAGLSAERIHIFGVDEAKKAGEYVRSLLAPTDIVLVKGSQGIRLEKAAKVLLKDPLTASSVLVRQEDAWRTR